MGVEEVSEAWFSAGTLFNPMLAVLQLELSFVDHAPNTTERVCCCCYYC